MAYPQVVSSASSANLSGSGSVSVTMPSGLTAGNLLLLFTLGSGTAGYSVSGWTLVTFAANSSGTAVLAAWVKLCTGSDTASITFGDGNPHVAGARCHQISGWSGTLASITGTSANLGASTSNLNSGNLTGAPSRDNLWFSVVTGTITPANISAAPTNYTDYAEVAYNSSAATLAEARRQLTATSDNPGDFTTSGSTTVPIAMTVVVPPWQEASATLAAAATLTAAVTVGYPAVTTLAATTTLTTTGVRAPEGVVVLAADSTLTVAGTRTQPGTVTLAATSTLAAAGVLTGASASLVAATSLTVTGVSDLVASVALTATSALTANTLEYAGTTLAAASDLVVAGTPIRPAAVALSATASLVTAHTSASVGSAVLAGTSTLTVEGVGPSYAQLKFQDMEATVTPPQGYLEPLPVTVGPNWQPGDVRFAMVSGAASSSDAIEDVAMIPDPPVGYTAAYAPATDFATEGVFYRYLASGDADAEVSWPKPSQWRYWFWSLLSVRGADQSTAPVAGRITVNHTVGNAYCTINSVTVPGPGVMVFFLGTTSDLDGSWPSWATSIGTPTTIGVDPEDDWKHLTATDKSGDKFYSYDANPALAVFGRKYETAGSTGTVTVPLALGAPAFIGMYMFVRGAPDGNTWGSPITATDSLAAGSSSSGTNPHSVGEPITATDGLGPGSNPVHGQITLDPYRLYGNPVEASRIQWSAVGDVTVETSINNGLSWDVASNWESIPRLRAGDTTTRTVLVRATLQRADAGDPSPRLKWLKVRIGCRKLTDELLPTFYGPCDKTKTKITAGSSGGTGSGGGGEGSSVRGGGMFGGGTLVKVHATDPSRLIKLAEWEQPFLGQTGQTYTELGRAMVLDRSPTVPLFSQVSSGHTLDDSLLLWGLDQGSDAWQDIGGVYGAIGHERFYDVSGAFVSRPVPDPRYGPVLWNFDHTVEPCIIGLESELDASQIVNGWVIKGESTTAVNPVNAYAFNTDTASPYNIFPRPVGIGKRIKRKTFPLARTAAQCQDIANGALNNSLGLANTVKLRIRAHPGIARGDVLRINSPETGVVGRFMAQGYELSDSPVAPMDLTCFRQTYSV